LFTSLDSLTTRFICFYLFLPFSQRFCTYLRIHTIEDMEKAKGLVVAFLRFALIEWAHVHGGTTKIRLFSWTFWDFFFGYATRNSERIKGGEIRLLMRSPVSSLCQILKSPVQQRTNLRFISLTLWDILSVDSTCTSKRIKGEKIRLRIRSLVLSLCKILKLPVQHPRTNPRFMSHVIGLLFCRFYTY
jgi:hypothetical protein